MTPREKILREGLDELAKYKSGTEFPNALTPMNAITMRGIARETLAKANALPLDGPFDVERDDHGHAAWIRENGKVVLWLVPGTVRGEEHVERIVGILNAKADDVEDEKGWFEVDSPPERMKEVLCRRGRRRFIGMLVGEKQLEASMEYEGDDSEYDEESDCFWSKPGWYEQAPEHDAVSWWRVDPPDQWQPLPEVPK